ncbi:hypothetical protein evm_014161 [Chilo suppressalis]|nr:hypothetical protein evm_014161 [Chilo suppressalis]
MTDDCAVDVPINKLINLVPDDGNSINVIRSSETHHFKCSIKVDYKPSMYFNGSGVIYNFPEKCKYYSSSATSNNSYNVNFTIHEVTLFPEKLKNNSSREVPNFTLTSQKLTDEKDKLSLTIFNAIDKTEVKKNFEDNVYYYKDGDHLTFSCSRPAPKSILPLMETRLSIAQMNGK